MKKTTLLMIVSLVLAIALGIGSTLAYLSDTDADVNVMTLGSVYITQNEQERNADGELVEFTPNKPAVPAVYDTITWDDEGVQVGDVSYKVFDASMKNVIDKIVTVTNTGKSDAYVRTLVAFESPEGFDDNKIHANYNSTDTTAGEWFYFEHDGVRYVATSYTYKEVLPAGATSAPSLVQLFFDKTTTNEDVELLGDEYTVLVLSQAVQAEGFDDPADALNEAFGAPSEAKFVEWFDGIEDGIGSPGDKWPSNNPPTGVPEGAKVVKTADELLAAIEAGGEFYLGANITLDTNQFIEIPADKEVTINMNGKTLTGSADQAKSTHMIDNKGKLTIKGEGTIDYASTGAAGDADYGFYTINNSGDLVIDGATVKNTTADVWNAARQMQKTVFAIDHKGGSLTIDGGKIESTGRSVRIAGYSGKPCAAEINGGEFVGQVWVQGLDGRTTDLTVNGGEFGPVGGDGSSIFIGNSLGTNTVAINDGLFNTKIGAQVPTAMINGGEFATQDAYDKTNSGLFAAGNTVTVK